MPMTLSLLLPKAIKEQILSSMFTLMIVIRVKLEGARNKIRKKITAWKRIH